MSADPFELLVAHVRQVAATIEPSASVADIVAQAIDEAGRRTPAERRRRRRWLMGLGVVAVLAVGTGAAAGIIAMRDDARPQGGIVCRSAPSLTASAVVLPLSDDPIGECVGQWLAGALPEVGGHNPGGASPALIACIGSGSAIEVLPVTSEVSCADWGLEPADVAAVAEDPVVQLQDQLVKKINTTCVPVEAATAEVRQVLDTLGLQQWTIEVQPNEGACGRAGVDEARRVVNVVPGPPAPGG